MPYTLTTGVRQIVVGLLGIAMSLMDPCSMVHLLLCMKG